MAKQYRTTPAQNPLNKKNKTAHPAGQITVKPDKLQTSQPAKFTRMPEGAEITPVTDMDLRALTPNKVIALQKIVGNQQATRMVAQAKRSSSLEPKIAPLLRNNERRRANDEPVQIIIHKTAQQSDELGQEDRKVSGSDKSSTVVQRGFFSWVKKGLGKVWGGIKGIAEETWDAVKAAGSLAVSVAKELGQGAALLIEKYGGAVVDFLSKWGRHAVDWISRWGTQVIDWVSHWGAEVIDWISRWGTQVISWLSEWGTRVINWLADFGLEVVTWLWNVIKSGGALIWTWLIEAPERVWRLIVHFGDAITGLATWVWAGLKKLVTDPKGLGKWLIDGLLGGLAWVGRLVAKVLDIVGFGEIVEFMWQIIKFNSRTLTGDEEKEARRVFGGSISYWQVRIDEASLIAKISSLFVGGDNAVTTFHTINFPSKISAAKGNNDMGWLIHELTHVSQMEHVGMQYMGEALHAQQTGGYGYGGPGNLAGKGFSDFNREQQGDIARDYYMNVLEGSSPDGALYQPLIDQLKRGQL